MRAFVEDAALAEIVPDRDGTHALIANALERVSSTPASGRPTRVPSNASAKRRPASRGLEVTRLVARHRRTGTIRDRRVNPSACGPSAAAPRPPTSLCSPKSTGAADSSSGPPPRSMLDLEHPGCGWFRCVENWRFPIDPDAANYEREAIWATLERLDVCADICWDA